MIIHNWIMLIYNLYQKSAYYKKYVWRNPQEQLIKLLSLWQWYRYENSKDHTHNNWTKGNTEFMKYSLS